MLRFEFSSVLWDELSEELAGELSGELSKDSVASFRAPEAGAGNHESTNQHQGPRTAGEIQSSKSQVRGCNLPMLSAWQLSLHHPFFAILPFPFALPFVLSTSAWVVPFSQSETRIWVLCEIYG